MFTQLFDEKHITRLDMKKFDFLKSRFLNKISRSKRGGVVATFFHKNFKVYGVHFFSKKVDTILSGKIAHFLKIDLSMV